MPKLKEVLSTEVHWQIADWHTRDQANIRIRQLMGDDARYFAPVYVTHSGYYWADAEPGSWQLLSDAADDDARRARALIETLRAKALARYPAQQQRIDQIFTRPNDDFVYIRHLADGNIDLRMTGWGFANFHRAYGGSIVDAPADDSLRQVRVCFSIDGHHVPRREFELWRSTSWAPLATDTEGYYDLGSLGPGIQIQVRDKATGKERIETIAADTSLIDVDVTEYLTVRVSARHDGVPIEGETANLTYGHRTAQLTLSYGVAEARLPWLEGTECTVELRGESQSRTLDKNLVNTFDFEFVTPTTPRTPVTVRVSGDGAPIAGEAVDIVYRDMVEHHITDAAGEVHTAFDSPAPGDSLRPVEATVRGASKSVMLEDDPIVFDFVFDTPVREEFDASLLVVDLNNEPVPNYPIRVEIAGTATEYLTDDAGTIALGLVTAGDEMKVTDGLSLSVTQTYLLNARQPQYVFVLPYANGDGGDCTLRVIELDGRPAAGVTCVMIQNEQRVLGYLDQNGEMAFSSESFATDSEIKVNLYTSRRTFPPLSFKLEPDEKEYELVEVAGPYPWWKVVLEVLAVAGCGAALLACAGIWWGFYSALPLIFA